MTDRKASESSIASVENFIDKHYNSTASAMEPTMYDEGRGQGQGQGRDRETDRETEEEDDFMESLDEMSQDTTQDITQDVAQDTDQDLTQDANEDMNQEQEQDLTQDPESTPKSQSLLGNSSGLHINSKKRKIANSPDATTYPLLSDLELGSINPQQQQLINNAVVVIATEQCERLINEMRTNYDKKLQTLEVSLENATKTIDDMQIENSELRNYQMILEGRLSRAEKQVEEMKEQQLVDEARSMRDNLMFFNVKDGGPQENTEETLRTFLRSEMKIEDNNMDKIRFDRVHRMGKYSNGSNRIIVGKFNPSEGKHIVFSHVHNLDAKKGFGVSEQLPRELAERKKQLIPSYKKARKEKKKVNWSLDKLVVEGQVKEVKKDKIKDVLLDVKEKTVELQPLCHHSPTEKFKGNAFQGHSVPVECQDDIVPALHAIYANPRVASAKHNVYAYRIKTANGYLEHFEDDCEWGAGNKLLQMMRNEGVENMLVCSTRWYGGTHIGKARFDYCLKVAKIALHLP